MLLIFIPLQDDLDLETLLDESSSDINIELVESVEQTDETIEYKVNIPKHPFNTLQKYSILFEEVCDTYNISREGSRAIRFLINNMLADPELGKKRKYQNLCPEWLNEYLTFFS